MYFFAPPPPFTRAIYSYYLFLGNIQKGEFLCVNLKMHDKVQQFDSAELMRAHWATCHGIDQGEILLPMVIPVLLKENAPTTGQGAVGRPGNPGQDGPPGGSAGPGADARPAGGSGTSNLERGGRPEGTPGSSDEAGKRSDKGQKVSKKGFQTAKVGKGSHVSNSAKRVMALRLSKELNEIKLKDKARKMASKKGKSVVVSQVADQSTGSLGNPEQGRQPEGATGLGDDAGPSKEVNAAEEVSESMEDVTNPEEGLVDPMDVEIAEEMANIFRGMPYRLEKK